jgi:hypothetical protein
MSVARRCVLGNSAMAGALCADVVRPDAPRVVGALVVVLLATSLSPPVWRDVDCA